MPWLTRDITSTYKSLDVYGLKDEEVKMISNPGTAMIVEGVNGKRLPIGPDDITDVKPGKEEKPAVVPEVKADKPLPFNTAPKKQAIPKQENIQQTKLF